jgi:hypothetical protein
MLHLILVYKAEQLQTVSKTVDFVVSFGWE